MPVPSVELAPGYRASRLIKGGWQSIGAGAEAVSELMDFVEAGVTTFETADAYPGGEEFIGVFLSLARRRLSARAFAGIRVHTRFTVPLSGWDASVFARSVDRSRRLLGQERLDLLQLQCWDLRAPGLVDAGLAMAEAQRLGKVNLLGACNLGVEPLARLLEAGIPITTNQVPYSLADRRADRALADFCARNGIAVLTYGPLAGGFLGDAWMRVPDPRVAGARLSEEYLQLIQAGLGWHGLQRVLDALSSIGTQRARSIPQVALRWALQRGPGHAVLFGATRSRRLAEILPVFEFELSHAECAALESAAEPYPPGDVGELERVPDSILCRTIRRTLEGADSGGAKSSELAK